MCVGVVTTREKKKPAQYQYGSWEAARDNFGLWKKNLSYSATDR